MTTLQQLHQIRIWLGCDHFTAKLVLRILTAEKLDVTHDNAELIVNNELGWRTK